MIASVRDVSERKEAEDALASEKRFAEAHFESLPGVAYVYDASGRLVRWNGNFEAVFGRKGEKLVPGALTVLDTICERDRARISRIAMGEPSAPSGPWR